MPERRIVDTSLFNKDAELPFELRLKDFEIAMQDFYDFFYDVNVLFAKKGLLRLDDNLRPAIMSGLLSDMLTASMANHSRSLRVAGWSGLGGELFPHRGGRISDLVDGPLQLRLRDAEVLRPVFDLMLLAHRDLAAVLLAFVIQIVACPSRPAYAGTAVAGSRASSCRHGIQPRKRRLRQPPDMLVQNPEIAFRKHGGTDGDVSHAAIVDEPHLAAFQLSDGLDVRPRELWPPIGPDELDRVLQEGIGGHGARNGRYAAGVDEIELGHGVIPCFGASAISYA